jgi:hypothetical protein
MQPARGVPLAPVLSVPRELWDTHYRGALPRSLSVAFDVAGHRVNSLALQGFVSLAEDEIRL